MKKLLPCFLFFICASASAQTNVYHPFPDSNAVWREELWATDGSFGIFKWEEEKFINGDTVIGGNTYHKIYESGLFTHCWDVSCFNLDTSYYYYNVFKGVIRQDTNKRIYTYDIQQLRDTLLYDFNLEVGDTIPDSYNHLPASMDPITVVSIDSIFDGTDYRKQFFFISNGGTPSPIIEGIGAACGLFVELDAYIYEHGGILHCFIQNDSVKYTDSSIHACDIIDVQSELPAPQSEILLSPNPFTTILTLHFPDRQKEKAQLSIFNSIGEAVVEKEIRLEDQTLNLAALPRGIYLVRVRSEEGIYNQKIVK